MKKKRIEETKTTEFELDGIEEAYEPARQFKPGQPWKPLELPKLQVETPPELVDLSEHQAKSWVFERRTHGFFAALKRWMAGKRKR